MINRIAEQNEVFSDSHGFEGDDVTREIEDIVHGRRYAVPFPGPVLTSTTLALLPGTVTCLCGDPGVGKSYFISQCYRHWFDAEFDPCCLMLEKDRLFYKRRILAQIENDSRLTNEIWIATGEGGPIALAAAKKNGEYLKQLGKGITVAKTAQCTLDDVLSWIRDRASRGYRVLAVDPITAVAPSRNDSWNCDREFVMTAQKIAIEYGVSIVLISHPKKGYASGKGRSSSGHDLAGGSAYFQNSDTGIWIKHAEKPRNVSYMTASGPTTGKISIFFQVYKARNGTQHKAEIAYTFDNGNFVEQGMVLKDTKETDVAELS